MRSKIPEFEKGKSVNCSAGLSYGSFNTVNPKVSSSFRINDLLSVSAYAAWLKSKGDYPFALSNGDHLVEEIRLNSDVNTLNAEVNLFGTFKNDGKLTAKANFHSNERGLPGSVVLYTQNPTERLWDRNLIASARYGQTCGKAWKICPCSELAVECHPWVRRS